MSNKSEVQKNFGGRAANYRSSTVHNNVGDIERMLGLLKPGKTDYVLDVATGTGNTAVALAGYVKSVLAVDITREMLDEAQAAAKEKGLENIEFRPEDAHNLTAPNGTFDIVASRFAVHHFYDAKKALFEMCRVLKPGGKLYILDCSVVDGDEAEKIMNAVELLRDASHVFSYSPRLWKRLLKDLPLKLERMELLKDKYQLPDWFDRMGTDMRKRDEIFGILHAIPDFIGAQYRYSRDCITTYRIEILGMRL
jgi:ubiquinone/menaquinone biosynthesis C-methylase UbiE